MTKSKFWTDQEVEFLYEKYGKLTTQQICEKLNRSRSSVKHKVSKLGLGNFFGLSEDMHLEEVARLVHRNHSALSRNWSKRGLKIRKVGKFRMIKEKDLIAFMRDNQDLYDATDTEVYFFEYYPWFREKLIADRNKKYKERIKCTM